MGGSQGHVSVAIAKEHNHLQFIVQDLPEIISNAALGSEIEEGVKKRVRFMTQDFLQEQTVRGDVFLLRWVLHDWPDQYVVRILRNLRLVLRNGDKVVVNDQLMPGPGEVSSVIERQIRSVCAFAKFRRVSLGVWLGGSFVADASDRFFDMVMLSFFNAREREKADWEGLFREADERFTDVKIWTPERSSFATIEATWRS